MFIFWTIALPKVFLQARIYPVKVGIIAIFDSIFNCEAYTKVSAWVIYKIVVMTVGGLLLE